MQKTYFRKRDGRRVEYMDETGKWKSTGFKEVADAKAWYYSGKNNGEMTFRMFAEDIFTNCDVGSYRYLNEQTNRHPNEEWWHSSDGILKRYLLPRFGNVPVKDITTPMVQDWYLTFQGINKQKLSPATKKKVLDCMSNVMQWAKYRGLITRNPIEDVIKIKETNLGRRPYTDEEMKLMFPEDDAELIQVWGTLMWATYFSIMKDTGWRPAEIAGLKVEGFIEKYSGIYTTQSVDSFTGKVKDSIKTADNGYKYKVGLISEQTSRLLKRHIDGMSQDSLVFTVFGRVMTSYCSRKHFRDRMLEIGVSTKNRPPYALRTTFMTNASKEMSREQVEELMGHKQWRACYDKRTPEDIVRKVKNWS